MRYVFLTGATGGLGRAVVELLSRRGYGVFAAGTNERRLAELAELPRVIPIRADVTDDQSVLAARETVLSHTPSLYAVVNFAGLTAFGSLVEGDCIPTIQRLLDINVTGTARVNRLFFELVRAGGGRIVNCSSEAGWMKPQPFAGAYFLSKRAVEAYNDSLRRELMFLGVPVVKIQPGSYRTAITDAVNEGFERMLGETRLYGRVLSRMKPMMDQELSRSGNPRALAAVVLRALEARRPRLRYRAGTGKLLALMELLPDRTVDWLYRLACGRVSRAE